MVLKKTETGPIELVEVKGELRLQFNCSCADALPLCKAMCCRMRPGWNVDILPEEKDKYETEYGLTHQLEAKLVLASIGNNCTYLSNVPANLCSIHSHKPVNCKNWHCSPGGKGEGITRFGGGWRLSPTLVQIDAKPL